MDGYMVLRVIGEGSVSTALLVQQENSDHMFAMNEIRLPKVTAEAETASLEISAFGVNDARHNLSSSFLMQNIFLTQNGKVKLGDFGSACLLSNPMVFACTYVGTPYYVPPEIWENMPYNNKSSFDDEKAGHFFNSCLVSALTIQLYFLVQANSWKSLILKICQGSMSPLPSQYSCELQHLIKQMFKGNPSHRPSAMTLLSRGSLAWLIRKCLPPEIITEYSEQVLEETKNSKHNTPRKKDKNFRKLTFC
eukprot:XP_022265825.1 serine/threonine-protein kinase Nek3 [Canis lupus familiaris]